jgi:hypothetical protein
LKEVKRQEGQVVKEGNKADMHCDDMFSDSDDDDTEQEALHLSPKYNSLSHKELLDWILEGRCNALFPNLTTTLRVILTYPVSVASAERSFSKLKLVKSYLRSTMGQDRLNGLTRMSIEKEIVANLDNGVVIQAFWDIKKRQFALGSVVKK